MTLSCHLARWYSHGGGADVICDLRPRCGLIPSDDGPGLRGSTGVEFIADINRGIPLQMCPVELLPDDEAVPGIRELLQL
jgi:hypothetical protein